MSLLAESGKYSMKPMKLFEPSPKPDLKPPMTLAPIPPWLPLNRDKAAIPAQGDWDRLGVDSQIIV